MCEIEVNAKPRTILCGADTGLVGIVLSEIIHIFRVVPRGGLEPPTHGLELHCSIRLSYRGLLGSIEYLVLSIKYRNLSVT